MSRMNLDTAIRLSAQVKGANTIQAFSRDLKGLDQTAKLSKAELGRMNIAINQMARSAGNTTAGLRQHVAALQTLRDRVEIGGKAYNRLGVEIQQLQAKLRGLDATAEKTGQSLREKLFSGLATVGVGRISAGITQRAANFDQEVRKAAAIEGTGSYDALRKSIERVAAVAAGTPTQVAQLATALSRAGFTADETSKSLQGIVRGAEASAITFEEMGSVMSDVMRSFGIDVSKTESVVDILVKSANSSNQTVLDLGEAMKYAAPVARTLGVNVNDLAATMALMANNGIRGSDAGTALRSGLSRLQIAASGSNEELLGLTRGSQLLARAMKQMGADVLDAQGRLKPMDQVILSLRDNMAKLPVGQRAEIAKALFGDEAGSKFLALLNSSQQQIEQMFGKIRNSGGAAAQTQKEMQGFAYSMEVLGGNIEIVTNAIGDKFMAVLGPLVNGLNAVVGVTQTWPNPLLDVASAAAAAGIAVGGMLLAINTIGGISAATAAMKAYTASVTAAGTASAVATTKAAGLLGVLGTLGKIGLITIGVKFAVEGLDELLTGLTGVQDAENAARAMAERRGLTYAPSAAVERRNRAASGYVSPFAGARDRAFELARQIRPGQSRPGAATGGNNVITAAALPGGAAAAAGGAGAGGSGGSGSGGGGGGAKEKKRATLMGLALAQGFSPENARIMAAIALAESGGRATAHNRKYPDNSYGLWQINMLGGMGPERRRQLGLQSNEQLFDPATNARAAKMVFNSQGFNAWSVFRSGAYKQYLGKDAEVGDVAPTEIAQAQIDAAERMRDQLKAADEQNVKLKDQLALIQETNRWKRAELEYDIKKNEMAREYEGLKQNAASAEELALINANQQIEAKIAQVDYERQLNEMYAERAQLMADITRAAAMPTVYNELETQQAALQGVLDKYPAIGAAADAAASVATEGMAAMIAGTQSAKQVFAEFLDSIAQALLDTAKQMIAQYIAIGIARIFAGLGGGGGGGGMNFTPVDSLPSVGTFNPMPTAFAAKGATFDGGMAKFAKGGIVNSPTLFKFANGGALSTGVMGEAGPEAIMPLKRGADGKLGVQANGLRELMGATPGISQQSPVLNMSFETTTINGVEYVSREQLESAMAETRRAAANDGAKRGMTMTLDRIQNSPSTKRRLGM